MIVTCNDALTSKYLIVNLNSTVVFCFMKTTTCTTFVNAFLVIVNAAYCLSQSYSLIDFQDKEF